MKTDRVYVIAEAGVNHNGSLDLAMKLIGAAVKAGADAVKFQTFRAGNIVSVHAPQAPYQRKNTGISETQFDMLKRLELSWADHRKLAARAQKDGIQFLSTPFDLESLRFLAEDLDLPLIKISSGEITNLPFLVDIARTGKPCILSTGMSSLGEVEDALQALAFGYAEGSSDPLPCSAAQGSVSGRPARQSSAVGTRHAVSLRNLQPAGPSSCRAAQEIVSVGPTLGDFARIFNSPAGQACLQKQVSLLHCTTEYPARYSEVNLRAIDTLRTAFHLPVGLSDHTPGIAIALAAVARGATVIEKHFTVDKALPGPDHKASLDPRELEEMVCGIRAIESGLGDGVKILQQGEAANRSVARKSLVALRSIRQGEIFTRENIGSKRPGTGLSPRWFWHLLGRPAGRDYEAEDLVQEQLPI